MSLFLDPITAPGDGLLEGRSPRIFQLKSYPIEIPPVGRNDTPVMLFVFQTGYANAQRLQRSNEAESKHLYWPLDNYLLGVLLEEGEVYAVWRCHVPWEALAIQSFGVQMGWLPEKV